MTRYFSPISRFYLYRALVAEGFVYPIITIYALANGISLSMIGLATGSFFLGTLLGELPTGYLGDRIGRRNSLFVGAALLSVTHIGFAFTETATAYVGLYAFWGVAATFRSGSADAWLYDTLATTDATEQFTAYRGRASSIFYASAATTALVGGLLYEIAPSLPFLAAAVWTALGAIVVATLPKPPITERNDQFSITQAIGALSTIVSNRRLGTFVVLSALVLAVPETVEIFVQPMMQSMGIQPGLFGPTYAVLMGAAALGSSQASRLRETIGTGRWFSIGPVMMAGALAIAVVLPVVAIPVFVLSRGYNTATETLATTFCNDQLVAHGRATALSGVSMVYAFVFFGARSTGGLLASHTSPLIALSGFGVAVLVVGGVIQWRISPFASARDHHEPTKITGEQQ